MNTIATAHGRRLLRPPVPYRPSPPPRRHSLPADDRELAVFLLLVRGTRPDD